MDVITIRASSLSDLFDCPHRWHAKHVLGIRLPAGPQARLGTSIHVGAQVYDTGVMNNEPVSIDDAAGELVKELYSKVDGENGDIDWGDESPERLEKVALALHSKYCSEIGKTAHYKAVELRCHPITLTDLGIKLTGSVDRIYINDCGEYGISDIKTGAAAVSANGTVKTNVHVAQLGVYNLLAEHALGRDISADAQIIGLNTGKTPVAQRVGVGTIPNPKAVLIGDEGRAGILEHAAMIIKSGSFYANPRSMLCSPKYCPAYSICKYKG